MDEDGTQDSIEENEDDNVDTNVDRITMPKHKSLQWVSDYKDVIIQKKIQVHQKMLLF